MPGRTYSGSGYRFGFNGKEKDDEVEGNGNIYDYGFRIYNPRIAKFLSLDPLMKKFPWYTPYQFAGNMPIRAKDLDGLEILDYQTSMYRMTTGSNGVHNETSIIIMNIPKAIASEANGDGGIYFKYKVAGMPNTTGHEPKGISFNQTIDEGVDMPDFYGTMDKKTTMSGSSTYTSGNNFKDLGGTDANDNIGTRGLTIWGAILDLKGLFSNASNMAVWEGIATEKQNRQAYYQAASLVDNTFAKAKTPLNAIARAAVTNYVLDGKDLFDTHNYVGDTYYKIVNYNIAAMDAAKIVMNQNGIQITEDFQKKYDFYKSESQKGNEEKKTKP